MFTRCLEPCDRLALLARERLKVIIDPLAGCEAGTAHQRLLQAQAEQPWLVILYFFPSEIEKRQDELYEIARIRREVALQLIARRIRAVHAEEFIDLLARATTRGDLEEDAMGVIEGAD